MLTAAAAAWQHSLCIYTVCR